jgi:hypothetical protein
LIYFTSFKIEGSSSGRLLILMHVKHTIPSLYIQPTYWRWTFRFETGRRHQKLKIKTFNLEKVHFVGLYWIIILQCILQKNIKNITVISLALLCALHMCDITSYDNSSSTNYAVRTICEKIMPEYNWYNWLTFIASIIPDTYVFFFLEEVKHRL